MQPACHRGKNVPSGYIEREAHEKVSSRKRLGRTREQHARRRLVCVGLGNNVRHSNNGSDRRAGGQIYADTASSATSRHAEHADGTREQMSYLRAVTARLVFAAK